ncbi:MAG: YidC/Oxa1 family membrane protein insertase [Chloroflexi bacterium]|nr:YidC/Oxa1 family membrane protein insertase [Chloroflexota bacterium]
MTQFAEVVAGLRRQGPALALAGLLLVVLAFAGSPVALAGEPSASPAASASPATGSSDTSGAPPCPNPVPGPAPAAVPGQTPAPTPAPNLCPAQPNGADPTSLISFLFTPIFQGLFLGLVVAYNLLGDIGLAIVALTIVIRILLVPVFRAQILSQRRMQLLQPEIKAIQTKYKGDRARISQEQMNLYKERNVNPASGCLPGLMTLVLLIPMYSVFSSGLTAPDISSMLNVFGSEVITVQCLDPANPLQPCIDPTVRWLGNLNASKPEILFLIPGTTFGLSLLALISALLQLVQTRMMMPSTSDPQAQAQQRVFLILPLFSLFYGTFLPAGLFIYWIVTTIFSIVQQYLIAGWGSLFPLFGYTPAFARNHTPRFALPPVAPPPSRNGDGESEPPPTRRSPTDRAAGTVRPARSRGRTSRRGRRR